MGIEYNLKKIKAEIPESVKLVAVTKTKTIDEIIVAYNSGHKIFGENRVQELTDKYEKLPKDIEWHMIGSLQTNKVKYIAPFVNLIHSVDSYKLLEEINKQAKKNNRVIDCLLEIYIASESSKHGLNFDETKKILQSVEFKCLSNIRIVGLMGMATYTFQDIIVMNEFLSLKYFFDDLKSVFFQNNPEFCELSMGMSGDYKIAIQSGATIVRIGSIIFGSRT